MSSNFDIGVDYTSSNLDLDLGVIDPSTLEGSDIEFIRLQWIDLSNTLRFRIMPVSYFKKLLAAKRGGINIPRAIVGFVYSSISEGFYSTHEYFYAPDIRTLRRCSYEPGHASLLGWFQEKAPILSPNEIGIPGVALCSRTTLKRVVDHAEKESNIKFLVGFESEFTLLNSTDPVEAVGEYAFSSTSALRPGKVATTVLNAIARGVQEAGIELQVYHPEAGPGQYEIVTGPLPPLEAVDALIHTREIIYNTAAAYGLRATFAPRISKENLGSAAHAHISVHSTLPDAPTRGISMSELEKSFLAGLMKHLPSLPALTLPTTASYARVGEGLMSGGTWVCWGDENREAPIRLTNPASASSRRFEMRFIDGTANPYLALAGIIGVGHAGVRQNLELTVKELSGSVPASYMSEDERKAYGIVDRMPLSWEEGRKNIQNDPELESILGKDLLESYLSVNTLLEATLNDPTADEDAKLKKVIDFY